MDGVRSEGWAEAGGSPRPSTAANDTYPGICLHCCEAWRRLNLCGDVQGPSSAEHGDGLGGVGRGEGEGEGMEESLSKDPLELREGIWGVAILMGETYFLPLGVAVFEEKDGDGEALWREDRVS
jgi:hypothetical protein